ncbi:hypothetical protein HGRIS_012883 [Hohenbuehelia grisea]|uniref:Lysophospholipase n=1 Tax=Hohenbuehelia grisea TaxID=104357 RepID=A0ABR3ITN1_9AGAR
MSRFAALLVLLHVSGLAAGQGRITDYAPLMNVPCPDLSTAPLMRSFVPQNQTIHPQEAEYVKTRESTIIPAAWESWLRDGSDIGYNLADFKGNYPRTGIAFSGGGYRASQYGAGVLSALDARNDSAKAAGTGGLLQTASYMTGLSGGSWLVVSLFMNDWPAIQDLVLGNNKDLSGWLLEFPLWTPGGINLLGAENQAFFGSVLSSVIAKANAGIDTSLTDPWARVISYHFLNQTTRENFFTNESSHGAGQLWSQARHTSSYQKHNVPFPIIVANSRPSDWDDPGQIPLTAPVYEISPLEFGSFDPSLSAMMNLTYAGTKLTDGFPENGSACVSRFDQAGFVMGTSASLFNAIIDRGNMAIDGFSAQDATGISYMLGRQLDAVRTRADDVANWPSPFTGLKNGTFIDSQSKWLELVDGGMNKENVPFGPLLVKSRQLDFIVGVDTDDDDDNRFPLGTSPLTTFKRVSELLRSTHQQFPPIPTSREAFFATGVNRRPTFFGCEPTQNPPEYPLVAYLPNSPPLNGDDPVTNTDAFKLAYTRKHTQLFLDQAHANTIGGFLPNTNSPDPNWGKCLQCAAIDRARYKRTPVPPRSAVCSTCFKQYCFDSQNPPSQDVLPHRKFKFVDPDPQGIFRVASTVSRNRGAFIGAGVGFVGFLGALIAFLLWRRRSKEAKYKKLKEMRSEEQMWGTSHDRGASDTLPLRP